MRIKHLKELEHKRFRDWLSSRCDSLESKFHSTMEFVSFVVSGTKMTATKFAFQFFGLRNNCIYMVLTKLLFHYT